MKPFSTLAHAVIDYLAVATLLALPWVFGASDQATSFMSFAAVALLFSAAAARHELGLLHLVPLRAHLLLDVAAGLTLVAMAFVLGAEPAAFRAALGAVGVLEIATASMTREEPTQTPV